MKQTPITKGREKARKRLAKLLEQECAKAFRARNNTVMDYGEHSDRAVIATAYYAELIGLQNTYQAALEAIQRRKQATGVAAPDTAVPPPGGPEKTA